MKRPRVAHVWVKRPNLPDERPGLVIGWVTVDGEQRAVVVVVDQGPYKVVTETFPAEALRPVHSTPRTATAYDLPRTSRGEER